jgi:hypothetical protein
MEEQKEERIKCNRCKVNLLPSNFSVKRDNVLYKHCDSCREKTKKYKDKTKCKHNRQRSLCKDCGGSSICEHNKQRSTCKECGGTSICEHNRQRYKCKECRGAGICEHNRQRYKCKECRGAGICEHNRRRSLCKECGGSSICEHNRERSTCKECGGSSICVHDRHRRQCKICTDPVKVTINNWIQQSRESDKKYDRYDANNYIDKCFLQGLVEDYPNCYYCSVKLQYIEYQDDLTTIERLDNSLGHIKSNCVLSCRKCNFSCVGDSRTKFNSLSLD